MKTRIYLHICKPNLFLLQKSENKKHHYGNRTFFKRSLTGTQENTSGMNYKWTLGKPAGNGQTLPLTVNLPAVVSREPFWSFCYFCRFIQNICQHVGVCVSAISSNADGNGSYSIKYAKQAVLKNICQATQKNKWPI